VRLQRIVARLAEQLGQLDQHPVRSGHQIIVIQQCGNVGRGAPRHDMVAPGAIWRLPTDDLLKRKFALVEVAQTNARRSSVADHVDRPVSRAMVRQAVGLDGHIVGIAHEQAIALPDKFQFDMARAADQVEVFAKVLLVDTAGQDTPAGKQHLPQERVP